MDGQDLLDYLGQFNSEAYRKQALDSIVSNRLYEKFLSTPEGKKVAEFFTKRITDDISNIIQIALAWDSDIQKRTEKIILLGTRAGVALSSMKEMVFQMEEGTKHIKAMKKEK
jgi:oligoribonuclease (3'-5' exoribonuclease)